MELTRRGLLGGAGGLLLAGGAEIPPITLQDAGRSLAALETAAGGRLGFLLLHTGTGQLVGHRVNERFALCSTFKLFLAGLVLQAADRRELGLMDPVPITQQDLVPPSPVTGPFAGKTLTVRHLAEGTQTTSDNAAANLLMRRLGGPYGVTQRLRALGDRTTRIDRYEPEMNLVIGADPRDTSTPEAVVATTAAMVLGDALSPASRAELVRWMVETRTGLKRLRAGAPPAWRVGDKTGTGYGPGRPSRINDIAVLWPPEGPALVAAAFLEMPATEELLTDHEAILADAMRLAIRPFRQA